MFLCECGFKTSSRKVMQKHIIKAPGKHIDLEWELNHLVIRGFDEDKPRMEEIRRRLAVSK